MTDPSPREATLQIFCAALQGYTSKRQNPKDAVKFAREVVQEAWNHNPDRSGPDLFGEKTHP